MSSVLILTVRDIKLICLLTYWDSIPKMLGGSLTVAGCCPRPLASVLSCCRISATRRKRHVQGLRHAMVMVKLDGVKMLVRLGVLRCTFVVASLILVGSNISLTNGSCLSHIFLHSITLPRVEPVPHFVHLIDIPPEVACRTHLTWYLREHGNLFSKTHCSQTNFLYSIPIAISFRVLGGVFNFTT